MIFKTHLILFIAWIMLFHHEGLTAQANDFDNSLNRYSFNLYHEVKSENENILLSPLSTYYVLLMAYEGSNNRTKQEFEKILQLEKSSFAEREIVRTFVAKQDGYAVTNAVWLDKSFKVTEKYRKSVTHHYLADFKQTDFRNKEIAVADINRWVAEKTNRRITDIMDVSHINPETSFILSNALYFKGEWLNKFDKKKTKSAPFFTNIENQYRVSFMNITEDLHYFETNMYQFIAKPYKDSQLSFCIVLPKEVFGLTEIEKEMDADFLKDILDSTRLATTLVSIPKLKIESNFELSNALKKMGLNAAFSDMSDFSGITEEAPLALDKILHKTVIELDEEKTEAAAATSSSYFIRGLPSHHVFKADHPFIFFVIDNQTKVILFMGRYSKPTDGEAIEKESLASNLEKRKNEKFFFGNIFPH